MGLPEDGVIADTPTMPGALVVSLDFELHWGVRDHLSVQQYRDNLLGVRAAIPAMLERFERRGIHATWATVGALFCATKSELVSVMPTRRPNYDNARLDPYDLSEIGEDEASDPFHFAPTLVERIARTPGQEVGTHTFSHFYCLEPGQTEEDFEADLLAARNASRKFGDDLMRSIVFPRNQVNHGYRRVLVRNGVRALRSNSEHWAYTESKSPESLVKRVFRLADSYLPLSGSRSHQTAVSDDGLVDVPASTFLRPWTPRSRHLEGLRLRRIMSAITNAARTGRIFHLWWHPHNFGCNLTENLRFLDAIIDHFEAMRRAYGMVSGSMIDVALNGGVGRKAG